MNPVHAAFIQGLGDNNNNDNNDNCNEAVSYYRRDNPFSGTIGGLSLVPLITF